MSEEFDLEYEAFLKTLGTRIKQLRNERGLTLKDMTVLHNYHDSQWRRYERGGSINVQSLLKIAKVFKTSLSDLLDGLGEYPAVPVSEIAKKLPATKRPPVKAAKKAE